MFLTDADLAELVAWRRARHREPELSGQEAATARTVRRTLEAAGADRIVAGLGGHGVAAVLEGTAPGPTVMLRAELDALPIEEISDVPHRSVVAGRGHMCGHDGHMATLAVVARGLGRAAAARPGGPAVPAGGGGQFGGHGGDPAAPSARCRGRAARHEHAADAGVGGFRPLWRVRAR
jgi:metal-dependent amidase/aminoacylase/carboxypeptidase family protein